MKYLKQIVKGFLFPDKDVVPLLSMVITVTTCMIWAVGSVNGDTVEIHQSWLNVVVFSFAAYWAFILLCSIAWGGVKKLLKKRQVDMNVSQEQT